MTIGDNVTVGAKSVVCAAHIGSCVNIGENCIISKRCILKDNSMVLPNTILPPDTIVPPLTVFGGNPGVYMGDLPESQQVVQKQYAVTEYKRFVPSPKSAAASSPKGKVKVTSPASPASP
eukprot:symbB.v1.2.031729.t1/scaffold3716.1/size51514/3